MYVVPLACPVAMHITYMHQVRGHAWQSHRLHPCPWSVRCHSQLPLMVVSHTTNGQ